MHLLLTLVCFIFVLGLIVLIHESGHFLFSKLFGVYVYEFSIGMGPKIFGRKKGETDYSIRAIPIGGYCSLAGEDATSEDEVPVDRRLYSKPAWQRFLIMFFGAGFNFIGAFLILFIIGLFWGSTNTKPILGKIVEDAPAYQAGLEEGDYVRSINGHKIISTDDILIYLQVEDKSKPITFTVDRDGEKLDFEVTPVEEEVDGQKIYRIGVNLDNTTEHGFLATCKYAVSKMGSLFRQMVITFKGLFTGQLSVNQLSGPVGIFNVVGEQAEAGFSNILYLIALLSVNVGFINLIPFPAFDGGRILFLLIEKIIRRPIKPEVENLVNTVGFILLMVLMVFVTFNDVLRLF